MKSTKINYLFEFPKFKKEISNINDIIFFFPFYHFGGGERVHADILEIFKDYKTTCFIVHKSENDFLKEDFYKNSDVKELGKYKSIKYQSYYQSLAKEINKKKNPIIFGCNNLFFYRLIPFLHDHVKVIDLTHAFTYEDSKSPEKFSIDVAKRIDKRIVLGKKTLNDFANLYKDFGIDSSYLSKISVIKNRVSIPESYIQKQKNENLKIIFVSRNSHEKRPEMFFEIAKRCDAKNKNFDFLLVGDFDENIPHPSNMSILGSIKDKELLNSYYANSDLLLITSFREGFPMVVLEGMAFGVVPICTNVGEMQEFIGRQYKNGVLIEDRSIDRYMKLEHNYVENEKWLPRMLLTSVPEDVNVCIDIFIEIIEEFNNNRNLLQDYSKNAYETIRANFSPQQNKQAYLDVFFN